MAVTAALVKELREKTGVGMMDCKNALKEADGDMEKAADILRKKGIAKAAKRADRQCQRRCSTDIYIRDNKHGYY